MLSQTLTALLILLCCSSLTAGQSDQRINMEDKPSVGTVTFKGSKLRVFEINGAQVAEPRVSFEPACGDVVKFNRLYGKYQLAIPININVSTLTPGSDDKTKVGHVTLTELSVKADELLASKESGLSVLARLKNAGEAELIILCNTFIRCRELNDEIATNPEGLSRALKFQAVGRVDNSAVKFGAIRSANSPQLSCRPGQWVVFQRRVDGSLSFAQNWDAYVKGFGNANSNYWMGLGNLFALTVTSAKNTYPDSSRCELRVETEDLKGNKYWGQYKLFEVLGPDHNYMLRLGQEVPGSQLGDFINRLNEMQFSTYDRDNDKSTHDSCSQLYGYGGWWYRDCHFGNLNGAYTTDSSNDGNAIYTCIIVSGKFVAMKTTMMKFRCN